MEFFYYNMKSAIMAGLAIFGAKSVNWQNSQKLKSRTKKTPESDWLDATFDVFGRLLAVNSTSANGRVKNR